MGYFREHIKRTIQSASTEKYDNDCEKTFDLIFSLCNIYSRCGYPNNKRCFKRELKEVIEENKIKIDFHSLSYKSKEEDRKLINRI